MKPTIKNIAIQTILERGKNEATTGTALELGYSMVGGYVASMLEIIEGEKLPVPLDLTYKTVGNLPEAIGWVFAACISPGSEYSIEQSVEIAEKTLAAYLICLALNEENAEIDVQEPQDESDETVFSPVKWSGFRVLSRLGTVAVDFLQEIHGSVTFTDQQLTGQMESAVSAYQRLTGKDLAALGVESFSGDFSE